MNPKFVRYHRFLGACPFDDRSEEGERLSQQRHALLAWDGTMSGDYSAANAVIVAVLIGLPVMVFGLFGMAWWERYSERRTARAESRRQRRRLGG